MKKIQLTFVILFAAAIVKAAGPVPARTGEPATVKVRLIRNNITVDSLLTSPGRPFCFFLKTNGSYLLSVSTEGQPPRLLRVSMDFSGPSPRRSYFSFVPKAGADHSSALTEEQVTFDEASGSFFFPGY